jgi:hemerythrin
MTYTWSRALETGHPVIDSQHRELINAINSLLMACQQGQGADAANATIDFLVSYTKKHFGDEEALQLMSNYPDYQNHLQEHATFVKVVTDLSSEMKQAGPTLSIIDKIIQNVVDWLVNHIQQKDTAVAAHLKN